MNIHFIAIGGSVMHQLAIALQRKGYRVTGSDDEIFDPAKSQLFKHGLLPDEFGWFESKIDANLDAVILGMHARPDNKELLKAQELGLPIYAFPQYVYEQAADKLRVVVGGSHGKTTVTAMIMHVLRHCGMEFDYLVGAALEGFGGSVKLDGAPTIVLEGDEYLSSPLHREPKFHFYRPQIAVLTGVAWDHVNVFPSFGEYVRQFELFLEKMPEGGQLFYYGKDPVLQKLVEKSAGHLNCTAYGEIPHEIVGGSVYLIGVGGQNTKLNVFGRHNMQNLQAARLVCRQLGVGDTNFEKAAASFGGAAKRLQTLAESDGCTVFLDFAHAPSKVKATVEAVRQLHPGRKLLACLELHTYSSLNAVFLPQYKHMLDAADEAVVFYNEHTLALKKMPPLAPDVVRVAFGRSGLDIFTDKAGLEAALLGKTYANTNLLLMSSGNFGGLDVGDIAKFAVQSARNDMKNEGRQLALQFLDNATDNNMLKLSKPLAIFDLEATGAAVTTDRIVEICVLKVMPDGSQTSYTQRINPTIPIGGEAEKIHGISDADVKDMPTFADIAKDLQKMLDNCDLGGYNSNRFDVPMLVEEFARVGIDFKLDNRKMVDAYQLFLRMEPRDLSGAYRHYCNKTFENAHSAEADVMATYEIILTQAQKYEDMASTQAMHDTIISAGFVDLAGRLKRDEDGVVKFNFGKHKGTPVAEVLEKEPQYYDWMMKNSFPIDTKQKLTAIKLQAKFG